MRTFLKDKEAQTQMRSSIRNTVQRTQLTNLTHLLQGSDQDFGGKGKQICQIISYDIPERKSLLLLSQDSLQSSMMELKNFQLLKDTLLNQHYYNFNYKVIQVTCKAAECSYSFLVFVFFSFNFLRKSHVDCVSISASDR